MSKESKSNNLTRSTRSNEITTKRSRETQFAVCINNTGYKSSLELGKLYRIIPDKEARTNGLVRIVDESGEDYAYSSNRFHSMKVPSIIKRALWHAQR